MRIGKYKITIDKGVLMNNIGTLLISASFGILFGLLIAFAY